MREIGGTWQLQVLHVTDDELCINANHLASLIEIVARVAPRLNDLTVQRKSAQLFKPTVDQYVDVAETLTLDAIRPLLSNGNITVFDIIHFLPFALSLIDIVEITQSWPRIKRLILSPVPLTRSKESALSPGALDIFAENCPCLNYLGVFLDAFSTRYKLRSSLSRFQTLRVLDIGTSPADISSNIAALLAYQLPPDCFLFSSDVLLHDFAHRNILAALQDEWRTRLSVWTRIMENMDSLRSMRFMMDEQLKQGTQLERDLRDEIAALKERLGEVGAA